MKYKLTPDNKQFRCLICGLFHHYNYRGLPIKWAGCNYCGHNHNPKRAHFCSACRKFHSARQTSKGLKMLCPKNKKVCIICKKNRIKCELCQRCIVNCGCKCKECSTCYKKTVYLCINCLKCKKCCLCAGRIGRENTIWQQSLVTIKNGKMVNSLIDQNLGRSIGLEIELSEFGTIKNWKGIKYTISRDASVHPSGQEMVLVPACGRELQENIYNLGIALISSRCEVNNTCGLHVHVDARDFGWWEIRKLLIMWLGIEKEMFHYFVNDKNRITGSYCIPYRKHGNSLGSFKVPNFESNLITQSVPISAIKSMWISMFYEGRFTPTSGGKSKLLDGFSETYKRHKRDKYFSPRYYALNIHSWLYRGTVEFRLKEGVIDGVEIRDWALLCGWIVEIANKITFNQAVQVYNEGIASLRDLSSKSEFSIKNNYILPNTVRNYITKRIS